MLIVTSVLCKDSVVLCWLELLRVGLGRVEEDIVCGRVCSGSYQTITVCTGVGFAMSGGVSYKYEHETLCRFEVQRQRIRTKGGTSPFK
jgi:hypothetical protein